MGWGERLTESASVEGVYFFVLESSGFGITGLRVNAKGSVDDFPGINVSEWAIRWRYDDGQWVAIRLECVDMGADVLFNRED